MPSPVDRHNRPGLISDFMNKGDLKHYLCDEHLLVEYKQLVRLAEFAARGMEYLSSKVSFEQFFGDFKNCKKLYQVVDPSRT